MYDLKKLLLLLLLLPVLAGCQKAPAEEPLVIAGQQISAGVEELDLSGLPLPAMEELEKLTDLAGLRKLDLRGTEMTASQYESLRALLPACDILWQVPFGGSYADADAKEITIDSLTEADLQMLSYFTDLREIHAQGCDATQLLVKLQALLPDCDVHYEVSLAGQRLPSHTESLTLTDADGEELLEKLCFLPKLQTLSLQGTLPDRQLMRALTEAYPGIFFLWELEAFGKTLSTDARELDFSGISMKSVDAVEEILPFFPKLEKVIMCNCGISSEEMDALGQRNAGIRFVWTVQVGMMRLRTDMTALMPFQHGYATGGVLRTADCAEMKYLVDLVCLDLGHMAVTDLSFVSHMPKLEYLLVCGNGIRDISALAGLEKLKFVELFANNITDISALAQCPALEDVNLCYNRVADVTPLLELENLQNLWMSAVHLKEDQIRILEEQLGGRINLQLYQSRSTGGGWRDLPNYFAQRDLLGMPYFTTP